MMTLDEALKEGVAVEETCDPCQVTIAEQLTEAIKDTEQLAQAFEEAHLRKVRKAPLKNSLVLLDEWLEFGRYLHGTYDFKDDGSADVHLDYLIQSTEMLLNALATKGVKP